MGDYSEETTKKMTRKITALCLMILLALPAIAEGPLYEGMVNICGYGGMAPSYFGSKDTLVIRPNNLPAGVNVTEFRTTFGSFTDHFRFPFIFGGSAGYSFTDALEINLSLDYITARGDDHTINDGQFRYEYTTGTFGSLGAYIGAKYYIDVSLDWYPFIQARGGFQLRRPTRATIFVNRTSPSDLPVLDRASLFKKTTVVPAGGVALGFDGPITEYANIYIMAELNYSGKVSSWNTGPIQFHTCSLRSIPLIMGLRLLAD